MYSVGDFALVTVYQPTHVLTGRRRTKAELRSAGTGFIVRVWAKDCLDRVAQMIPYLPYGAEVEVNGGHDWANAWRYVVTGKEKHRCF